MRNFCNSHVMSSKNKQCTKQKLFDLLKSKMGKEDPPENNEEDKRGPKKILPKRKDTRKVELGWIHNGMNE